MIKSPLEEIAGDPSLLRVLQAYATRQRHAKTEIRNERANGGGPVPRGETWIPRLASVDGIPDEALSRIHGKLIALGLLRFQLSSREKGVSYQLSLSGRNVLGRRSAGSESGPGEDIRDAA